jgi:hypothetical protein
MNVSKLTGTIICLIFLSIKSLAQPTIQWQKAFGGTGSESAGDIKQTKDGGYVLIGSTASNDGDVSGNHGSGDVWVVKLNSLGALAWQKTFGGTGVESTTVSIEETNDGGYVFIDGTSSNDGDVSGNHGGSDVWVVKLNSSGTMVWQKTFGGTAADGSNSNGTCMIKQTKDGGYVFVSSTASTNGDITSNHGGTDIWVVKTDSVGNKTWGKTYGGTSDESSSSIEQTTDGGYIVAGYTKSNNGDVTNNYGLNDEWILKLDSIGNISWQKTYGGSQDDKLNAVHQTADGGYITVGNTSSSDHDVSNYHDSVDIWVTKLLITGGISWAKTYGGTRLDGGNYITQISDGNYILAGNSRSADGDISGVHGSYGDMWLMALYQNGTVRWKTAFGGSTNDAAYRIIPTTDNGYIAAGLTTSNDGDAIGNGFHGGTGDFWAVKLSSVTGVEKIDAAKNIRVFPTHTTDLIHVSLSPNFENATLKIFNLFGQEVKFMQSSGQNRLIHVGENLPGIYLLQLACSGRLYSYKIILQ